MDEQPEQEAASEEVVRLLQHYAERGLVSLDGDGVTLTDYGKDTLYWLNSVFASTVHQTSQIREIRRARVASNNLHEALGEFLSSARQQQASHN